jgi:hypothetical protein
MKTIIRLSLVILAFGLASACSKDRDTVATDTQLTGLAAFLNGEFEVTQVDYNGSLSTPVIDVPLSGTGTSTQGSYNFNATSNSVVYDVETTLQAAILGQSIDFPVNVGGTGAVDYVSATRFTINDPVYGLTSYDVSNQTSNSLRATTRYEADTLIGSIDLLLDIYMTKK